MTDWREELIEKMGCSANASGKLVAQAREGAGEMTDNIIAHLRRDRPLSWTHRLKAADEIIRLREENARLRETLQYIADPYHNSTTSKDRLAFLARAAIREGE